MGRASDPAFRKLRARLGAYSQLAQYDPRETTRAARAAFNARFDNEVDPQRVLPELERARRAEAARRAYFARLALKRFRGKDESSAIETPISRIDTASSQVDTASSMIDSLGSQAKSPASQVEPPSSQLADVLDS
jgi:hypothetical protein